MSYHGGMKWLEMSTENCPIQRSLNLIGEKWSLLLLRDAFTGVRRFDDFRRHVGLSEAVLSARLRKPLSARLFGPAWAADSEAGCCGGTPTPTPILIAGLGRKA